MSCQSLNVPTVPEALSRTVRVHLPADCSPQSRTVENTHLLLLPKEPNCERTTCCWARTDFVPDGAVRTTSRSSARPCVAVNTTSTCSSRIFLVSVTDDLTPVVLLSGIDLLTVTIGLET